MDNTLITQDRLDEIVRLAGLAPGFGDFAEVGVYKGGSLKELANLYHDRRIVGFDTFEGLPKDHWQEDEYHEPGEFADTSLEAVSEFLADNTNVILVKGIFPESAKKYRGYSFSFVHIDTDFYLSVKACIKWFWPRMLPGGIIVFDDFDWPNCAGVRKALEESGLPFQTTGAEFQAYIQKPHS